jgi:hypothetical protein
VYFGSNLLPKPLQWWHLGASPTIEAFVLYIPLFLKKLTTFTRGEENLAYEFKYINYVVTLDLSQKKEKMYNSALGRQTYDEPVFTGIQGLCLPA